MVIEFTKMHGLGNDFVVIDAISQTISLNTKQIKAMSDRHFGIGCDQLLLVEIQPQIFVIESLTQTVVRSSSVAMVHAVLLCLSEKRV